MTASNPHLRRDLQTTHLGNVHPRRVLLAGIGNVLRRDDGFGPAVIQALDRHPALPGWAHCVEVGIGGIGLVLELLDGYETLIIVDAVDRGGRPGTLYELELVIPELAVLATLEARAPDMDMHEIGPGKALVIARALGVLPPFIRLIGCQPGETEELSTELSPAVQKSVAIAVQRIFAILDRLYPGAVSSPGNPHPEWLNHQPDPMDTVYGRT